jgi:hypothetical protein
MSNNKQNTVSSDMPPSADERARLIASRLRKAKQLSSGEWLACSPLGDDEHPSFSMRAGSDGRVLVYDHRPGVTFEAWGETVEMNEDGYIIPAELPADADE